MTRPERRKELEALRETQAAQEELRRRDWPTDLERMTDRLDKLIYETTLSPEMEELARILKWHITGSEH